MYQTVGHNVIENYAKCMDLPCYRQPINGTPINQEMNYETTDLDETEDLFILLKRIQVTWLFCLS
jgi:diphthine-ammonia ligase